ncbi:MAG: hypothetical protein ABJE66_29215 [Deltaproteobacteria bacterium]
MRYVLLVLCSCAASLPPPSGPAEYACPDHILTDYGEYVGGEPAPLRLTSREDDHDVFASLTGERTIVIPHDRHSDAVERVHHAAAVRSEVCRARGGYTDMAMRYIGGESIEHLAHAETGGDREVAYELVRKGLWNHTHRLHDDR